MLASRRRRTSGANFPRVPPRDLPGHGFGARCMELPLRNWNGRWEAAVCIELPLIAYGDHPEAPPYPQGRGFLVLTTGDSRASLRLGPLAALTTLRRYPRGATDKLAFERPGFPHDQVEAIRTKLQPLAQLFRPLPPMRIALAMRRQGHERAPVDQLAPRVHPGKLSLQLSAPRIGNGRLITIGHGPRR